MDATQTRWTEIALHLEGLQNEMLALESRPDANFLDLIDQLNEVIDGIKSRYLLK